MNVIYESSCFLCVNIVFILARRFYHFTLSIGSCKQDVSSVLSFENKLKTKWNSPSNFVNKIPYWSIIRGPNPNELNTPLEYQPNTMAEKVSLYMA